MVSPQSQPFAYPPSFPTSQPPKKQVQIIPHVKRKKIVKQKCNHISLFGKGTGSVTLDDAKYFRKKINKNKKVKEGQGARYAYGVMTRKKMELRKRKKSA